MPELSPANPAPSPNVYLVWSGAEGGRPNFFASRMWFVNGGGGPVDRSRCRPPCLGVYYEGGRT